MGYRVNANPQGWPWLIGLKIKIFSGLTSDSNNFAFEAKVRLVLVKIAKWRKYCWMSPIDDKVKVPTYSYSLTRETNNFVFEVKVTHGPESRLGG